ncbi:MAG: hypothetical protein L0229_13590 [Blastocatellia bacterium]|nr:hypothetical protein [Blastocatellia bacterium]
MSGDLTKKLDDPQDDKLDQIIAIVKDLAVEVKDVVAQAQGLTTQVQEAVAQMAAQVQDLNAQVKEVVVHVQGIDTRLAALEEKVDMRLQETRPIWETVLARLDNLEADMKAGFRNLDKQMVVFVKELHKIRTDMEYLEDRVTTLEGERP